MTVYVQQLYTNLQLHYFTLQVDQHRPQVGEASAVSVMRFIGSLLDFDICVAPITSDPGRLFDRAAVGSP